jgi:hypothetical protein
MNPQCTLSTPQCTSINLNEPSMRPQCTSIHPQCTLNAPSMHPNEPSMHPQYTSLLCWALLCCARSACTAFGAGRDPTGRNRPIGYFSPPKTTPKPPGTTIFGRLYTNMKQSCNNHALIMHQSCSNHALSCNNHALIMH